MGHYFQENRYFRASIGRESKKTIAFKESLFSGKGCVTFAILLYKLLKYFKVLISRKTKMGLRLPGTFRIVSTPTDVALGFPNSYTEVTLIAIDIERSFFEVFLKMN